MLKNTTALKYLLQPTQGRTMMQATLHSSNTHNKIEPCHFPPLQTPIKFLSTLECC